MTRPFLLMVAGPNGAGKTTLTSFLRRKGIDFGVYINPDEIALGMTGTYDERVRAAQFRADEDRERCIDARTSFSFETVMSHSSKLDILSRAKSAGFQSTLYFVGTDDPATNVERVAARVLQGGHDVPTDKIIERWHRTMRNLRAAMGLVESSYIFDNSSIDVGPRLILNLETVGGRLAARHVDPRAIPDWIIDYGLWPSQTL